MSYEILANKCGLKKSMIDQVMIGRRSMSLTFADRIAEVTKSNFRIWLDPKMVAERREAYDKWLRR